MKITGQWFFHYGYYSNNNLTQKNDTGNHVDRTVGYQRVRTQFQFIADENLSAMLNMEANMVAGGTGTSGIINADKTSFVIKRAHLDWTLPGTQVKTRMGIQGISMPYVALGGHPVLNADVSGISVSSQLTPEVGLTAFWARPYDGKTGWLDDQAQTGGSNFTDEMDMFGFILPIKTDAVRFTPWGMFALIGRDSAFYGELGSKTAGKWNTAGTWVAPDPYSPNKQNWRHQGISIADMDSTTYGWWLGTSFELPVLDPFFVNIDAMMGGLETGDNDYDTFGWYLAANIGYKFSWGALSVLGWYSSGDKDVDDRGTMPTVSDDSGGNSMTRYGLGQRPYMNHYGLLSFNGLGMWGIGLQLANFSFVDNLSHTAKVMFMGGTNEGDATPRRSVGGYTGTQNFGSAYFMSSDRAWEINLLSEYKVNQNLKLHFDLAYVWLDLGDHWTDKNDTQGSFASTVSVVYSF